MTPAKPAASFGGLFSRRERWGLSLRGWLLSGLVIFTLALTWLLTIQSFLAPTQRVTTKTLVLEGWVHPFAIEAAVKEFQSGHYEKLLTTGGPVIGYAGYVNDFNTSASVGAKLLIKAGVPASAIQMVPSRVSGRNRTYNSALALRKWLAEHSGTATAVNVLTEDVHARRTWLLFQWALDGQATVGIISAASPEYDAKHWWRYSEGVREVLGETIAYLYARLLFRPEAAAQP